jgi:hypothetical protein
MRMGQNFTMGDTGMHIDGSAKITGLNHWDLGGLINTTAAAISVEMLHQMYILLTITRYQFYDSSYHLGFRPKKISVYILGYPIISHDIP